MGAQILSLKILIFPQNFTESCRKEVLNIFFALRPSPISTAGTFGSIYAWEK
jgi:hypothetical protein